MNKPKKENMSAADKAKAEAMGFPPGILVGPRDVVVKKMILFLGGKPK